MAPRAPRCRSSTAHGARRVVLAVPVAPPETFDRFADVADEIVVVATPYPFDAIGAWYEHFTQTTDDEVRRLPRGRERADAGDGLGARRRPVRRSAGHGETVAIRPSIGMSR